MLKSATTLNDSCDYCGLPIASVSADGASENQSARYCCYGCRFAASIVDAKGDSGHAQRMMTCLGLAIFFSMNVMVFTMFLWSQPEHVSDQGAAAFYSVGRYLCLLFSFPVLLLLGGRLWDDAADELKRGRPSLNLLLLAGVGAAFAYSAVSVFRGTGHVYFEVSCMVLVAVTLGRWLEANGKLKTTAALRSLEQLLPDTVCVVGRDGTEATRPRESVKIGERLRVLAGERIPVDGCVVTGVASVDQQTVTGESEPVLREMGDVVFGGTLNLDGNLVVEATASATDGILRRMIDAVAQAIQSHARYQRLAERISAWFLPIVSCIALGVLVIHTWFFGLGAGLLAALSVVVIACPCALGLATPMALWSAIGRAARAQILLRDGDSLTKLAAAKSICFDKTGTLTTGTPTVVDFFPLDESANELGLQVAFALANSSKHPLSVAIQRFSEVHLSGARNLEIQDSRTLSGRGVIGFVSELSVHAYLGSERLVREQTQDRKTLLLTSVASEFGLAVASVHDSGDEETSSKSLKTLMQSPGFEAFKNAAHSLAFVGWDGEVRGAFSFREQLREGVADTIDWLKRQDFQITVLTGDRITRADQISRELGVEARAELLPEDKLAAIRELQKQKSVVMVGDGINDAPSLAAADVGVALGCGTDVSRFSASVCLLGNDLRRLPWLVELARRTERTIRWNLTWAFIYNVAGIGLAATGFLNPIFAAAAMAVSSLLVVTNSLRLSVEGEA